MKRQTQRNVRLVAYALIEVGGGVLFGVALGLAGLVQALDVLNRGM